MKGRTERRRLIIMYCEPNSRQQLTGYFPGYDFPPENNSNLIVLARIPSDVSSKTLFIFRRVRWVEGREGKGELGRGKEAQIFWDLGFGGMVDWVW